MHSILYSILFFAIPVLIVLCFSRVIKRSNRLIPHEKENLDRMGVILNILLALFYLPLSIVGTFFAMMGEPFIGCGTEAQLFLSDLIAIFGFSTPLVAYGGLIVSALLRGQGQSRRSFLFQFSGIVYLLLLMALSNILFLL